MKDRVRVRPLRPHEKIKLGRLKRQRRNAVNSRNSRIIMLAVGNQRNTVSADMVGCTATWVRQPRHGHCRTGPGKRVDRLRATYSRKGGGRHFLAFYDWETDRLYGRFTKRKTWKEFLSFLQWIRSRSPRTQKLHIVMDNYGPHLKKEVQIWAGKNNVRFYLTPTNGSWLHRIECQCTELKKFALEPSDHRNHEEQQQAIESYLAWRNRCRALSLRTWIDYKRQNSKRKAA